MTPPKRVAHPHDHVSKAAQAWKATHLTHTHRAEKATTARDQQHESTKAADAMNNQTKAS